MKSYHVLKFSTIFCIYFQHTSLRYRVILYVTFWFSDILLIPPPFSIISNTNNSWNNLYEYPSKWSLSNHDTYTIKLGTGKRWGQWQLLQQITYISGLNASQWYLLTHIHCFQGLVNQLFDIPSLRSIILIDRFLIELKKGVVNILLCTKC